MLKLSSNPSGTPSNASCPVLKTSLWPPNHKMVEVKAATSVTDNQDASPKVDLVGIKVSEPDDGQGSGNTSNDVLITADGRIFVRAERSGQGNGRIYTVTYRAIDAAGNIGYNSANVTVPKSQGAK